MSEPLPDRRLTLESAAECAARMGYEPVVQPPIAGRTRRLLALPKVTPETQAAAIAEQDARAARSAGRGKVKLIGRTTETDPTWAGLIQALTEHGYIHPADLGEATRSLWVKGFNCPNCGSSSGFARRDKTRAYDRVRISCSWSCGTRTVAGRLELLREPNPADPFGADPNGEERKTGPR